MLHGGIRRPGDSPKQGAYMTNISPRVVTKLGDRVTADTHTLAWQVKIAKAKTITPFECRFGPVDLIQAGLVNCPEQVEQHMYQSSGST